jgi:PAS domain S-box-containing protein
MAKTTNNDIEKDILLSHFTLENLHEEIFWIDSTGKIFQVNESACKTSGYTREELLQMTIFDLNPSENKKTWPNHWKQVKAEKKITLNSTHKHKEGFLYEVEITNNFIEFEGTEYSCSVVRDIRKRKMNEELLRIVSEATSGLTGKDFFVQLARHITITLNMRYALITECANEEKTRLRTLCYLDGEVILDNIEYDTSGTPCEIIMRGEDFFMANDVEKHFPKETGIEAYVGVPIYSPVTGEVMGHIIAVDPNPVATENNQTSVLKIFASRAGAELERMKVEEKLRIANKELQNLLNESEERYRDLFDEAPFAYVHEGLDSKFIKANRAALKTLGVKPEEVPFMYGKTLVADTPDNQQRLKEAFDTIGKGSDKGGVVLQLHRKDNGQPIWIEWWSNPDPSGEYTRTMFLDITEKVLMEQEQVTGTE